MLPESQAMKMKDEQKLTVDKIKKGEKFQFKSKILSIFQLFCVTRKIMTGRELRMAKKNQTTDKSIGRRVYQMRRT